MSWHTRPAVRKNVGLVIGISGPTGSGKTWSALEIATGLADGERFCVIDTEHDRALMYADDFTFDHCPFVEPFSSERYGEALDHNLKLGYKVIVIDSASHEYIGEGGMHDVHDRVLDEMVERSKRSGPDWQIREALTWPAWKEPKRLHKRFKSKLISLPVGHHVILCFRAESKTAMVAVKGDDGKSRKEIRPKEGPTGRDGWFPLCDAALPYEMTLSLLVLPEHPGLPLPIKAIPERLKPLVPLEQQLSRESGRLLAKWTRGGTESPAPSSPSRKATLEQVRLTLASLPTQAARAQVAHQVLGVKTWAEVETLADDALAAALIPESVGGITRLEAAVIQWKEAHQ